MTKKQQKFAYWLGFAGILLLQTACSVAPVEKKTAKPRSSTPVVDKKAMPAKPAAKKEQTASIRDGLDGEILYYVLSADIAAQRGQVAVAAALYTKAALLTRDVRLAQLATRTAYYARDNKRAIAAARLWNELQPGNIEARQVLAALLVRDGKLQAAARHFEYVLNHNKGSLRQSFNLITSLLSKEKDKQAALQVMKKLIARRQDNPDALYAYAQLAYLLGDLPAAQQTVKKALHIKPEWTDAWILQTNILIRMGGKARALAALKASVEEQEDNNRLRMFYARNLVDARQYEAASAQFRLLLDDEKLQYDARFALGLLSLQLNKPQQAAEQFQQLLQANKRVAESRYYLAQSYELQNRLDEAISMYRQVRHPQYGFEAELRTALMLAKKGKLEEARLLLQNLSPDSVERELRIYLTEGEMLSGAKKYQAAFDLYSEALQQLPDNNRLLYARSLAAEKLGRIDDAVRDLENVVKREPENAQALNALGYTLVDRTTRIKQGFAYIQKAYRIEPDDPAIQDSMGWAYYRMGQYDKALKYLRMAFDKLKDAEIAAHLGEVLWVAGDREAAQEVWNAALKETPDDALLLDVMQKFNQ